MQSKYTWDQFYTTENTFHMPQNMLCQCCITHTYWKFDCHSTAYWNCSTIAAIIQLEETALPRDAKKELTDHQWLLLKSFCRDNTLTGLEPLPIAKQECSMFIHQHMHGKAALAISHFHYRSGHWCICGRHITMWPCLYSFKIDTRVPSSLSSHSLLYNLVL